MTTQLCVTPAWLTVAFLLLHYPVWCLCEWPSVVFVWMTWGVVLCGWANVFTWPRVVGVWMTEGGVWPSVVLVWMIFPGREAGNVCLPPLCNLRAVIWFHYTIPLVFMQVSSHSEWHHSSARILPGNLWRSCLSLDSTGWLWWCVSLFCRRAVVLALLPWCVYYLFWVATVRVLLWWCLAALGWLLCRPCYDGVCLCWTVSVQACLGWLLSGPCHDGVCICWTVSVQACLGWLLSRPCYDGVYLCWLISVQTSLGWLLSRPCYDGVYLCWTISFQACLVMVSILFLIEDYCSGLVKMVYIPVLFDNCSFVLW